MHLLQSAALSVQADGNMHIITIASAVVRLVHEVGVALALTAGRQITG